MSSDHHCIIFIPGFKGSILKNQHNKIIWLDFLSSQFSQVTLNYHLPELELPNIYEYYSTEVLKSIPIIPYVYNYNIYENFIKQLNNKFSKVIAFHYDWRERLETSAFKLNQLISTLYSQGVSKIDLICHSMGGLIAAYLLRYGKLKENHHEWEMPSSLINKTFLIATPFRGVLKAFHDLVRGDTVGLNHTLLSTFSLCTFPSIYYLLPFFDDVQIENDKTSQKCLLNDLRIWEQFNFGILNFPSSQHEVHEKRKIFLQTCLKQATEFHAALNKMSEVCSPISSKLISITSNYDYALSHLKIDCQSKKLHWQLKPGDGSLPLTSTKIPNSFSHLEHQHYLVHSEHSKMLLDKDVQRIIWQELL